MARHLFIVARDKPWLYGYLLGRFGDDAQVMIVVDRRTGERRRAQQRVQDDRRRGERRIRADADAEELATRGYFIVDL